MNECGCGNMLSKNKKMTLIQVGAIGMDADGCGLKGGVKGPSFNPIVHGLQELNNFKVPAVASCCLGDKFLDVPWSSTLQLINPLYKFDVKANLLNSYIHKDLKRRGILSVIL